MSAAATRAMPRRRSRWKSCRPNANGPRWNCSKSKSSTTSRSTSRRSCTTNSAASHWDHWGSEVAERGDYPAHEVILMWQDRILSKLLSPLTLTRLHDSELKTAADADALTTAELLERLTKAVYSEVDTTKEGEFTNRKPAISSLRRNLQRAYLRRMSQLALGETSRSGRLPDGGLCRARQAQEADRLAASTARRSSTATRKPICRKLRRESPR